MDLDTPEEYSAITIEDAVARKQCLYLGRRVAGKEEPAFRPLPPPPPMGGFDARIVTDDGGAYMALLDNSEAGSLGADIAIQSDAYPVTLRWEFKETFGPCEITDTRSGRVLAIVSEGDSGTLCITDPEANKITFRLIERGEKPMHYELEQNFPNPFNPTTTFRYALPNSSHVVLSVYDALGRVVATLVDEHQEPGFKSVVWDAREYATGVYFCRLTAEGQTPRTQKVLLLR